MKKILKNTRKVLNSIIKKCISNREILTDNPEKNFTRKRIITPMNLIHFILTQTNGSTPTEILKFFKDSKTLPTVSAIYQQRYKLNDVLFQEIFNSFNKAFPPRKTFNGYRLIAGDGSSVRLPNDPDSEETRDQDTNKTHLNALFDICNKSFTDVELQHGDSKDEYQSINNLVDRSDFPEKTIIIADRGYSSYNVLAHVEKKHYTYIIRTKDIDSTGLVSGFKIRDKGEFDKEFDVILTRKHTNLVRENRKTYKFLSGSARFDFFNDKKEYNMKLRIVRVKLDDSYEILLTNLSKEEFPPSKLKELYFMRWGIESAFKTTKVTLCLEHFRSTILKFNIQEVYAKLIMYNFSSIIANAVLKKHVLKNKQTHTYVANLTQIINGCLLYIRPGGNNIANLIEKICLSNMIEKRYRSYERVKKIGTASNHPFNNRSAL